MKPLPAPVEQAQHSRSLRPACQAVLTAHQGMIPVPAWEPVVAGVPGSERLAAAVAGDGSVLRLRVAAGEAFLGRVPAPAGPAGPWSSWTAFGPAESASGPALAARGTTVLAAVVDPAGTVQVRRSGDGGASWTGWAALDSGGGSSQQLALALVTADRGLLLAQRAAGSLRAWSWSLAGGWTAPLLAPDPAWAGRGVAVVHDGNDWLVLTVEEDASGAARLRERWLGDGGLVAPGSWTAPATVLATSPGGGVVLRGLSLVLHGVPRYRVSQAASSGWTLALEASRVGGPVPGDGWTEPVPAPPAGVHQPVLAGSPNATWRLGTVLAERAPLPGPSLDLGPWLRSASWFVDRRQARATLVLDNARGGLDGAGSGGLALLRPGSRLAVTPGIVLPDGTGWGRAWHGQVRRVRHEVRPGLARVLVEAEGPWEVLAGIRLQQPLRRDGLSPAVAAALLLARGGWGGLASLGTSPGWAVPGLDLAASPGTSLAALLAAVLDAGPDEVVFREGMPVALDPLATAVPVAALGPGHPALAYVRGTASPAPNLVIAAGGTASWVSLDPLASSGVRVQALPLDDAPAAVLAARTVAVLDRARAADPADQATLAPLIGLDLLDRLAVTVPRSGLAAATRRVEAITLRWSAAGDWEQQLALVAPGEVP